MWVGIKRIGLEFVCLCSAVELVLQAPRVWLDSGKLRTNFSGGIDFPSGNFSISRMQQFPKSIPHQQIEDLGDLHLQIHHGENPYDLLPHTWNRANGQQNSARFNQTITRRRNAREFPTQCPRHHKTQM